MTTTRRQNLINYLNDLIAKNPCLGTIIEIKETPLTMNMMGEYAIFHFAKTNDYYIVNLLHDMFVINTDALSRAKWYLNKHNI